MSRASGIPAPCFEHTGFELTANLRTKILDFRGFDSSRILNLRGGILMYVESTTLSRNNLSTEIGRMRTGCGSLLRYPEAAIGLGFTVLGLGS